MNILDLLKELPYTNFSLNFRISRKPRFRIQNEEEDEYIGEMYGLLFSNNEYLHLTLNDLYIFLEKYGNFQKTKEIRLEDLVIVYYSNGIENLLSVSRSAEIYLKFLFEPKIEETVEVYLGTGYSTKIFDNDGEEVLIEKVNSLPDNYLNPEYITQYLLFSFYFQNKESFYFI